MAYPKGQAPDILERLADLFRRGDAFVIVSAEYNHGISPGLSNTLDHFLEEYFWRPSPIVCYSGERFGGVRAAMQLRAILNELGMPSTLSLLPFLRPARRWIPTACRSSPGLIKQQSGSSMNSPGAPRLFAGRERKARPTDSRPRRLCFERQ